MSDDDFNFATGCAELRAPEALVHLRAVLQRVERAEVTVSGDVVGAIEAGIVALVGVGVADTPADAQWLASKVATARIFRDVAGLMNLDLLSSGGHLLAISQFTLFGDLRRGRRPSFSRALAPAEAEPLFDCFVAECRALGVVTLTGRFGAEMKVSLCNDGPVTLLLDSKKLF